jgi:uncharacterized protein
VKRVAVIGSGISGLAAAHALATDAAEPTQVTLFEADDWFGGHAHTVDVTLPGADGQPVTHGVDTGFLVFNHRTYPQLVELFAQLGVDTADSEMSFSVQVPRADGRVGLEWSGNNLSTVFAQRRRLLSPRFLGMLAQILRFNRLTTAIAQRGDDAELAEPIGDFLVREGFGRAFRDWYFLPMIGCIWSCPTEQMLRFPVGTMIRFCHNHGLLQVNDRPQWRTVRGGSRHYVQRMVAALPDARLATPVQRVRRLPPGDGQAGVWVETATGSERFDEVVLACHSDQALALLADATQAEREVLGAIRYHDNLAVLHTDAQVLPQRQAAWAAWNYVRADDAAQERAAVCLHYWINRLQPLPWTQPVVVSLNPQPGRAPDPAQVLGQWTYAHPVFDAAAVAAQRRLPEIQGRSGLWFCGAWTRYGFHEDGLMSGLAVARAMRARLADRAGLPEREAA